ncbi:hypothetical protein BKA70DRAFT_1238607 [Coprinopsis sp. MPI-PUGE-AT-0042]|nr:hypothetical protein BKA70DRAFT_1238607 [Coprinopsis sp. MPI-PUGE-AT-0042]
MLLSHAGVLLDLGGIKLFLYRYSMSYHDSPHLPSTYQERCEGCRKVFTEQAVYHNHINACARYKTHLDFQLKGAQKNYVRKRVIPDWASDLHRDVPVPVPREPSPPPEANEQMMEEPAEPEPRPEGRGHRIPKRDHILRKLEHFEANINLPFLSLSRKPVSNPLPTTRAAASHAQEQPAPSLSSATPPHVGTPVLCTLKNPFGVYKQYSYEDPHFQDPDAFVDPESLVEETLPSLPLSTSSDENLAPSWDHLGSLSRHSSAVQGPLGHLPIQGDEGTSSSTFFTINTIPVSNQAPGLVLEGWANENIPVIGRAVWDHWCRRLQPRGCAFNQLEAGERNFGLDFGGAWRGGR